MILVKLHYRVNIVKKVTVCHRGQHALSMKYNRLSPRTKKNINFWSHLVVRQTTLFLIVTLTLNLHFSLNGKQGFVSKIFCWILNTLNIEWKLFPCFHEIGHSAAYFLHFWMCLLSFWHLRLHFCLPHQQAHILDKSGLHVHPFHKFSM